MPVCQHRDADDNSLCDKCGESYTDGKDVDEHTHSFVEKNIGDRYLASDADCKNPTKYYFSCSCGEKGEDVFSIGSVTEHSYVNNVCTKCEEIRYSERLKFKSNGDGTCYVSLIGKFHDIDIVIPPVSPAGDKVTSIGEKAFYNCWDVESIIIPDSVTSIGDSAFYDCSSLTSVTIGNGVTYIGSLAFEECSSLKSITIPDSVTYIGSDAFRGCLSLTSVIIPDSVTSIGSDAFYNCKSLTSVTIPDSVTSIGSAAFYGCSSLTSVTIGNGVTSIGSYAFFGCSSLISVTIGNGVTSIGSYAFFGCQGLTSITIPDSVTSIGYEAFVNCTSLTSIKYRGTKEQWDAISKSYDWDYYTGKYTITYNYKGE